MSSWSSLSLQDSTKMVVVVNGEILPDTDPRAIRAREQRATSGANTPAASASSSSSSSSSPSSRFALSSYFSGTSDTVRNTWESGRRIRIPAISFLGKPAVDVSIYAVVLAGLLIYLLGIQGGIFVGLMYTFYTPWIYEHQRREDASSATRVDRRGVSLSPHSQTDQVGSTQDLVRGRTRRDEENAPSSSSSQGRHGTTSQASSRHVLTHEEREARLRRLLEQTPQADLNTGAGPNSSAEGKEKTKES